MLLDILKQFNWIDILIVIVLIRMCYIAVRMGFAVEAFKLLGTVFAVFFAFHYYLALTDVFNSTVKDKLTVGFLDFASFVLIGVVSYLALVIFRLSFLHVIKIEAVSQLNKWGSFVFGIARGILLSSLIVYGLFISSIEYFQKSVTESYLGSRIYEVAPSLYKKTWSGLVSKFVTTEKPNTSIQELKKAEPRK